MGSAGSIVGGLVALLVFAPLYFIPTFVATSRKQRNASAIFILNACLGWTVLGWIFALIWAFTDNVSSHDEPPRRSPVYELMSASREALALIEMHAQEPEHKVLAQRLRDAIAKAESSQG
jgi:hypothetical protein